MNHMRIKRVLALLLPLAVVHCDKSTEPTATPEDPATKPAESEPMEGEPAAAEPGAPEVAWAEKSFEQKKEFMGVVFYKEMKTKFQAHDSELYAKFTCATCHGEDAKEVNWAMPSDSILPLSKTDPVGQAMEFDEEVTQFMVDVVVPESAKLLDMEPYNPETGQGFGCFGCHPAE